MTDDSNPRLTLRGEFLRAERFAKRAVELATERDEALRTLARVREQLDALDGLATPEVTPSEDMRAAFELAARGVRAALDSRP